MLAQEQIYDNGVAIPITKKLGIVQTTGNYGLFKLDPRNRPIDPGHLLGLHDAVEKRNLLREYPILVDEQMTVIDGQHRLKVAESLRIPIYYIVSDRVTVEDVASTNMNTLRWTNAQYLHYWCAVGNIEYLKLRRFVENHPFIKLSIATELCTYGGDRRLEGKAVFAMGHYSANDIAFAEKVSKAILQFSEYVAFYRDRSFIATVANLMSNADYDHEHMLKKMDYMSSKLVKCPNLDSYMDVFTEIYNHRMSTGGRIVFRKISPGDARHRVDRKGEKKATKG